MYHEAIIAGNGGLLTMSSTDICLGAVPHYLDADTHYNR